MSARRFFLTGAWVAFAFCTALARAGFNFDWSAPSSVNSGIGYTVTIQAYFAPSNGGDPYAQLSLYREGSQVGAGSTGPYSWMSASQSFTDTGPMTISYSAEAFSYFGETGYTARTVTVNGAGIATTFSLSPSNHTYDGSGKSVGIVPNPGGATYDWSGVMSATSAGTYGVGVVATGSYNGAAELSWTIGKGNQSSVNVSASPSSVVAGGSVTFTASGGSGTGAYQWSGSASGSGSPKTVTFASPGTYSVSVYRSGDANYNDSSPDSASVEVTAQTFSLTVNGGTGGGSYSAGQSASLSPNTPTGSSFTGWTHNSGPGSLSGNSFTMGAGNATVTGNYSVNSYTLTVNGGGGGGSFACGENRPLSTNTPTGYSFTGWTHNSGPGSLSGNSFTMGAGNATVTGNYSINSYTLTVNGGSGSGSYAYGTQLTIVAGTPPTGQVFGSWSRSGAGSVGNAGAASTTFTVGAGNATVTANFASPPDTQAPSEPAGLQISNITPTQFTFSWNAATDNVGITGYEVRLDNNGYIPVTGLSYVFGGLTANSAHTVKVRAKDAAGNKSTATPLGVTTAGATGGSGVAGQTLWFDTNGDGILDKVTGSNSDKFTYHFDWWYTYGGNGGLNLNSFFFAWNAAYGGLTYNDLMLRWTPSYEFWQYGATHANVVFDIYAEAGRPLKVYRDPSGLSDIDPSRWELVLNLPGFPTTGWQHVGLEIADAVIGSFKDRQLFLVDEGDPIETAVLKDGSGNTLATADANGAIADLEVPDEGEVQIDARTAADEEIFTGTPHSVSWKVFQTGTLIREGAGPTLDVVGLDFGTYVIRLILDQALGRDFSVRLQPYIYGSKVDRDDYSKTWNDAALIKGGPVYSGDWDGDMVQWQVPGVPGTYEWSATGPQNVVGPSGENASQWRIGTGDTDFTQDWLTWKPGHYTINCRITKADQTVLNLEYPQEVGWRSCQYLIVGQVKPVSDFSLTPAQQGELKAAMIDDMLPSITPSTTTGFLNQFPIQTIVAGWFTCYAPLFSTTSLRLTNVPDAYKFWATQLMLSTNPDAVDLPAILTSSSAELAALFADKSYRMASRFQAKFRYSPTGQVSSIVPVGTPEALVGPTKFDLIQTFTGMEFYTAQIEASVSPYNGALRTNNGSASISLFTSGRVGIEAWGPNRALFGRGVPFIYNEVIFSADSTGRDRANRVRMSVDRAWNQGGSATSGVVHFNEISIYQRETDTSPIFVRKAVYPIRNGAGMLAPFIRSIAGGDFAPAAPQPVTTNSP